LQSILFCRLAQRCVREPIAQAWITSRVMKILTICNRHSVYLLTRLPWHFSYKSICCRHLYIGVNLNHGLFSVRLSISESSVPAVAEFCTESHRVVPNRLSVHLLAFLETLDSFLGVVDFRQVQIYVVEGVFLLALATNLRQILFVDERVQE